MAIYIKPSWRKYIPHLSVHINVPLVNLEMSLMSDQHDMLTFMYLGFFWRIWKWNGRVRLFQAGNHLYQADWYMDEADVKGCGCWVLKKKRLKYFCEKHATNLTK